MSTLYLWETNTVSHLIKRHPHAMQRLQALPMHSICISAITAGEPVFCLAKEPEAVALRAAVNEFPRRVEILFWGEPVTKRFGTLRAQLQHQDTPLAALDIQIAAQAQHVKAVLVSRDAAFLQLPQLDTENWLECS